MSERIGRAPGRVNLIGEHTDYNGGFVLPVALPLEVLARVAERPGDVTVSGPQCDERSVQYARAVGEVLGVEGFAARLGGDLPAGEGLGSSAALALAIALALRPDADPQELALLCHRAETEIVGVPSGVMDQLSAALGRPRQALLIDCASIEVRQVPLPGDWEFVVASSGVRHANAESGYRERVAECRAACEALEVQSLRELDFAPDLPGPLGRRVRHVVEENRRVLAAVEAIETGDAAEMAALMRESHASQRDLYEVSVPDVDELVERLEGAGALAARLTGGGFGGSVVAFCRGHADDVAVRARLGAYHRV